MPRYSGKVQEKTANEIYGLENNESAGEHHEKPTRIRRQALSIGLAEAREMGVIIPERPGKKKV